MELLNRLPNLEVNAEKRYTESTQQISRRRKGSLFSTPAAAVHVGSVFVLQLDPGCSLNSCLCS